MPLDRPVNVATCRVVVEVCPSWHIRARYAERMNAAPVLPHHLCVGSLVPFDLCR